MMLLVWSSKKDKTINKYSIKEEEIKEIYLSIADAKKILH